MGHFTEGILRLEKIVCMGYEKHRYKGLIGKRFFNNILREENGYMGKGDRRTKRGKLFRKSYGVKRPRKKKTKSEGKK